MTKEFLYQDKKIVYHIIGEGKPVVLVHGFGEDSSVWKNQIEFLKKNTGSLFLIFRAAVNQK